MDTLTFLRLVARALTQTPSRAGEIYVFGSTAKQLREFVANQANSFGSTPQPMEFDCNNGDIDLVITVPSRIYEAWNRELNERLTCVADCSATSGDSHDDCKWTRFNLALKLLGCGTYHNWETLYGWLSTLDEIKELDLHLMPEDWRSRTTDIQSDLPHRDPLFVSNIARDAIRLTEFDTADCVTWSNKLLQQLSRMVNLHRSMSYAPVFSAMITHGRTVADATPQC